MTQSFRTQAFSDLDFMFRFAIQFLLRKLYEITEYDIPVLFSIGQNKGDKMNIL